MYPFFLFNPFLSFEKKTNDDQQIIREKSLLNGKLKKFLQQIHSILHFFFGNNKFVYYHNNCN